MRVFLLERSRVTSTFNEDERSYHAFYQLIKAGTQYIAPNDCKAHRYTAFPGTAIDSPGINDTEWFADCNKGFASIAVSPSEVDVMWGYVAAMLLHLQRQRGWIFDISKCTYMMCRISLRFSV